MKPAAASTAKDRRVTICSGGVGGGLGGPVVKRPPQTGPKQPAGGIEEAPCCTDRPDSWDSSEEDGPSAGGWEDLSQQHLAHISLQTVPLSHL